MSRKQLMEWNRYSQLIFPNRISVVKIRYVRNMLLHFKNVASGKFHIAAQKNYTTPRKKNTLSLRSSRHLWFLSWKVAICVCRLGVCCCIRLDLPFSAWAFVGVRDDSGFPGHHEFKWMPPPPPSPHPQHAGNVIESLGQCLIVGVFVCMGSVNPLVPRAQKIKLRWL